jgi:CheY-like chemotaxis protein
VEGRRVSSGAYGYPTKEIRRLERVNSIGVFSSGSSEAPNNRLGQDGKGQDELIEDDRLGDKGMFKSPVIIVALTASSLQSDRHEALAAGCNDFLTKVRSHPLSLYDSVLIFALACQLRLARTQS